jgi:hypothetical protein
MTVSYKSNHYPDVERFVRGAQILTVAFFTHHHSLCERATTMRARILDRIVASAHIEDSDAMPAGFYELPSLQILELKTCDTETIRLARGTKFKEAGAKAWV